MMRTKRVCDFFFSMLGIIVLFPLFIPIAILIKLDSKGPVFYKGIRLGRFGKPFKICKLRTMVANAETIGPLAVPEGDSRVTKIGKYIRKYKLDEFPQLINVLKGEMSLVGPRPDVANSFERYTEEEKKVVLSVRPGMTDYGSLRFHDEDKLLTGAEDPEKIYFQTIKEEKVRLQLKYIKEQSLWVDIKIIALTLMTILKTRLLEQGRRGN